MAILGLESWSSIPRSALMARYRIIERNSFLYAGVPMYDVEERCLWWWEPRGIYESCAEAEQRVAKLKTAKSIPWKVVKKYD